PPTPPPPTYPLSLHDALPISGAQALLARGHRRLLRGALPRQEWQEAAPAREPQEDGDRLLGLARRRARRRRDRQALVPSRLRLADRKSTRLNSSHVKISYAVF